MKQVMLSILLACSLSACGFGAQRLSKEDPAYAPTLDQPIAVVIGDNSTIDDRKILPLLLDQLPKMGFTVTERQQATWILGMSTREDVVYEGESIHTRSFGTQLGGLSVAGTRGESKPEYSDNFKITLVLFLAKDYNAGKVLPIWSGSITTTSDQFEERPKTLLRAVLATYGKDVDDGVSLPRHKEASY